MTTRSELASWSSPRTGESPPGRPADIAVHIFRLAAAIEGNPHRAEEWYRSVCIRELGGVTAQELVRRGKADLVLGFLWAVWRRERD